jgi:hypothetical protein
MARTQAQHQYRPFNDRRPGGNPRGKFDGHIPLEAQSRRPLLALVHGSSCDCHTCRRHSESLGLAA